MAKLKDLLSEDITTMGGVVSKPAFSNIDMGFKTTKLTDIVEDVYGQSTKKFDAKGFMSEVGNFNSFGNEIYREGNLRQLAEKLSKLAETAKQHTLQETEDWFDKKVATEAQSLQERMSGLYEDMGHILGRYYEINESNPNITKEAQTVEADTVHEGTYEDFFQSAMKKFNISSPDELEDDEKVKFFNYVDKNYSAKSETD